MKKEIIFGLCDKTGSCDSYYSFFKTKESALKELQIQADRLREDLGIHPIEIKGAGAYHGDKLLITIHSYTIR